MNLSDLQFYRNWLARSLFIINCALFISCSHSDTAASGSMDWQQFRGNPSLSGYTGTRLPEKPVLLWTYRSETRTSSSPIIDKGTTYWCNKRGLLCGVNIKGELVFEYDLKTAVEATPMIHDSTIYIGRMDGFMTAISLAKKDTLWNYETMGQISASPNMAEFAGRKAIVFGSYDSYLHCVDAKSGEALSRFESGYYLNGAAALSGEYVIFGGCDSWVRIIDGRTGVQTDSLLLDDYIPASPAVAGNECYVGDYSGNIYRLVLEGGKMVRRDKVIAADSESGSSVAAPAISNEAVYFFSGERSLHAVSRDTGQLRWAYLLKGATGESAPVVCNNKVIVCTKTGIVSIIDTDTGELLWEYDTGEPITASPAVIKGHFMVLTAKGTLLCFGKGE